MTYSSQWIIPPENFGHEHTCRTCGAGIPCYGNGETCWDGGDTDCPESYAHEDQS